MNAIQSYKTDRGTVRRFLLESQGLPFLKKSRSTLVPSLQATQQLIQQLECIQLDPVSVVERNHNLVLAARLPSYQPNQYQALLSKNLIFEYWANAMCAIPIEDYPFFEPIRKSRQIRVKPTLDKMKEVVNQVLNRFEKEGALPSRAFKADTKVNGYWDNQEAKTKETSYVLTLLLDAGLIRVVRREGGDRFFGISDLTLPRELLDHAKRIEDQEAIQSLIDKYIRSYRVIDPREARFGWMKLTARERQNEVDKRVNLGELVPIEVEGVKRPYYVMDRDLERLEELEDMSSPPASTAPLTFLAPLDNFLWSRNRIHSLFDFDYKWEIYIPASKRNYGPYAMPILLGDRLIGRLDPLLDRKRGKLVVRLLQIEPSVRITNALKQKLAVALRRFARFHSMKEVVVESTRPEGINLFDGEGDMGVDSLL